MINKNQSQDSVNDGLKKWRKWFPFITGATFGVIWSLLYVLLGILEGMWGMADSRFPFLFSTLLPIHAGAMPPVIGAVVALADGAAVGFVGGLAFRRFLRWRSGRKDSYWHQSHGE